MPEWKLIVRERLGTLGISPEEEAEVVSELASHLDEVRTAALRQGLSADEASALAHEEVPDWVALNQEISAAKEGPMRERTLQLWLPGMAMLISGFILMLAVASLVPPTAWTQPGTPPVFYTSFLVMYAVLGGLGANWSRRAGGSTTARFLAGVFPVALHLVIFICVLTATYLQHPPRTPEYLQFGFAIRVFLSFVLIPGIALALGALPFLRNIAARGPVPAAESR